jgi:hypothetical protein
MKQLTLLCAMALVSFMACQKENASTPTIAADNYLPLKVGNYWIYTLTNVSGKGIESTFEKSDSVYIEKDTSINGQRYFKMVSTLDNLFGTKFLRDSLHYIVDHKGVKLFSSENFTDTLQILDNKGSENFLKIRFYKMEKQGNLQTAIGIFNCLDYRMKGILVKPIDGDDTRYCNNYYAKNIGIVKKIASYISNKSYVKEDLIRYKIQ